MNLKKLLVVGLLSMGVGCMTPHTGVYSEVTTLFGIRITTPTVGSVPAFKGEIGLLRSEVLTLKGSNCFNSTTVASDSGLFQPVSATRTIHASSTEAIVPSQ